MTDQPSTMIASGAGQDHLPVIDALRGYAILLVIAVHTLGHVPDLVWPVKRIMAMGFYGVQLFFLASAVTLMMSWNRSTGPIPQRSLKFMVRRFFRIAPLYWMAVFFYWFAYEMQPEQFSAQLLLATLFFYNAWSPYLIPTVSGWTPVPGGWSIGVEFCFYLLFPLIATVATNLCRSLLFFAISLLVMLAASHFGQGFYPEIGGEERSNFLYFWPPNQLVIFSLGILLYHLASDESLSRRIAESRISADGASLAMICAMLAIALTLGLNKFFDWERAAPPTHLVMSVCFALWALVLLIKPSGWVVNRAIAGLGTVSFSAYVLHFALLKYIGSFLHLSWPFGKTGLQSIAFEATFVVLTVLAVRVVAGVTYRVIEQPFIAIGKRLLCRRPRALEAHATQSPGPPR